MMFRMTSEGRFRVAGLTAMIACALVLGSVTTTAAEEGVQIGDEVPEIALVTLDGEELSLSSRRGVGPTVLVFFRGVW